MVLLLRSCRLSRRRLRFNVNNGFLNVWHACSYVFFQFVSDVVGFFKTQVRPDMDAYVHEYAAAGLPGPQIMEGSYVAVFRYNVSDS